jgi:hypothetical protein
LHRSVDVLELYLACIVEDDLELALGVVSYTAGNANAAGVGQALKTDSHIDVIPEDVAAIDDDIADVYADTKLNPLLFRDIAIALNHAALDVHGTTHGIDSTAELGQQPVSRVLDDTAAMFGDLGIDKGAEVVRKPGMCTLFIQAGEPAVSSDIGRQDGCKSTLYALPSGQD